MSVPAKRRSRSKVRRAKNHKKTTAVGLSNKTMSDGIAAPHRLGKYIELHENTHQEKRAKRTERKNKS